MNTLLLEISCCEGEGVAWVLSCMLVGVVLGPKRHLWMCSSEHPGGDIGLLRGRILVPVVPLLEDLDSLETFARGDEHVWRVIFSGQLSLLTEHILHVQQVYFSAKTLESACGVPGLHCLPSEHKESWQRCLCLSPCPSRPSKEFQSLCEMGSMA